MQLGKKSVLSALVLGLGLFGVHRAAAQSDEPIDAASAPITANSAVVTGHAFSAMKYARRVKILPDGKQQFIKNEIYPTQIARDAEGRIRIEPIVDPQPECDQPTSLVPPPCPFWSIIVFDPTKQVITHWHTSEPAGHGAVAIKLSASQVDDAENSTTAMPVDLREPAPDEAKATTEKLGDKTIDGVRASGVRTTTVLPAGYSGNKTSVTKIHEVWRSEEMRLVIKIIDGDPNGEETIAGLDHVSLQPDPALFEPPDGSKVQIRAESGDSVYADRDITLLVEWFVK
jgi:hypothetical protein